MYPPAWMLGRIALAEDELGGHAIPEGAIVIINIFVIPAFSKVYESFHSELLHLANDAKCMIFISGYENELYKSILSPDYGWREETIEATTKDSTGNIHARTEVVWMNKYFTKAQDTQRVPIELTDKELKENKLNPERP